MRRLSCDRYPCHYPNQDCTFCFCPFYPCLVERTGGRFVEGEWCCQECTVVHQVEVVEMIMESLMQGQDLSKIWKEVLKRL